MYCRDAAGFSNPGGLAVMWWAKSAPPLVVIGLTELQNSGWAKAHPAHPLAAALFYYLCKFENCELELHKFCGHIVQVLYEFFN